MISYGDMTFCNFNKCKHFSDCHRAFTLQHKKNAIIWWGSDDFPISLFAVLPNCYEEEVQ